MDKNPAVQPIPAIGVSVAANVGTSMQVTLQTFFDRDAPVAEGHKIIDALVGYAQRQEAIALLPGLRDERDKLETTLGRFKADLAVVDGRVADTLRTKRYELEKLQAGHAKNESSARADFEASGRQGDFKLTGSAKSNADRFSAGIGVLESEVQKIEAEREQELSQLNGSIAKYEADIAKHRRWIAEKEALINPE